MYRVVIGYLLLAATALAQNPPKTITALKIPEIPLQQEVFIIATDGSLNTQFSDDIYNQKLCCKTELYIIELNTSFNSQLVLRYRGDKPEPEDISIAVEKPGTPQPVVISITYDRIILDTNCSKQPHDDNYWSKVDMTIFDRRFSFRLDCDSGKRHRNFEWGYVIIMVINSIIMVGVALHSRIWSIKFTNNRALGIPVKWTWLVILTGIVIALGGVLIYVDSSSRESKQTQYFGQVTEVVGDVLALILGIINLNELFFLAEYCKKKVFSIVRICDILSIVTSGAFLVAFGMIPSLSNNYIFNNILSIMITVGAIKLFKFLNLRDAFICCFIIFAVQNITALLVHYLYHTMSYNDFFGSNVSSPLVLQVSILSYYLYQKCSWLPVTEVILPGITIAYLRRFDYARDSMLYLVFGNMLFVVSTILWILIQSISVHALPFSLITYPFLFIPVFILAYKRDELKNLLNGKFYDPEFMDSNENHNTLNTNPDRGHFRESTLQGLIPESDDLQKSSKEIQ